MTSLKQLIEQEVAKVLSEARSTPGNPNTFWLVTSIGPRNEKIMQNLADGVLEGVSGISDNNRILMHWLGIGRNSVLVMKAKHVFADNRGSIHRIMYDDPYQLTEDNMALLRRIFNAAEAPRGNGHIVKNIWSRMYQDMLGDSSESVSRLGRMMRDGYLSMHDVLEPYIEGQITIDSPRDFARMVKAQVDEIAKESRRDFLLEFNEAFWLTYIKRAITDSVRTYASEGEWIVDDSELSVPPSSRLLVSVHHPPEEYPEEAQTLLKTGDVPQLGVEIPSDIWTMNMESSLKIIASVYKYGLDKLYDVRFINAHKWQQIQSKLQSKHKYG